MAPVAHLEVTKQEIQCDHIFEDLQHAFDLLDNQQNNKQKPTAELTKAFISRLEEARKLVAEFESVAKANGMPADEIAKRKESLNDELSCYMDLEKDLEKRTDTSSKGPLDASSQLVIKALTSHSQPAAPAAAAPAAAAKVAEGAKAAPAPAKKAAAGHVKF